MPSYNTEEQIERFAEHNMNCLDRALMRGELSQTEYDGLVRALDRQANAMLKALGL